MVAEPVERSDDGRYIIVGGRRWRAADPSIPTTFNAELVHELMDARRAVGAALRSGGDVAPERARVSDAKIALGERGEPWWEEPSSAGRRERIRSTMCTLLRARGPDSSICPSDVARTIGGSNWRSLMPEVRRIAADLATDGIVVPTQHGEPVDATSARGPIRIVQGAALKPAPEQ